MLTLPIIFSTLRKEREEQFQPGYVLRNEDVGMLLGVIERPAGGMLEPPSGGQ